MFMKAFDMARDLNLVLESFRGTKIKILETDFQKMRSAKLSIQTMKSLIVMKS